MTDQPIEEWVNVAAMMGTSVRSACRQKGELLAAGAIFIKLRGFPPRRVVCGYPSKIREYMTKKSKKSKKR